MANGLKLRGIDATTTQDAGLLGASDEAQLAFASSEGHVVVTHDDDFLKLHGQATTHAGIVYANHRRSPIGRIVHSLVHIWRISSVEEMRGRVEFI